MSPDMPLHNVVVGTTDQSLTVLLFLVAKECTSNRFLNSLHRYGGVMPLRHLKDKLNGILY